MRAVICDSFDGIDALRVGEMPEPGLFFLRRTQRGDPWMSRLTANEAYQNEVELQILGINDFHGNIATTGTWGPGDAPAPFPFRPLRVFLPVHIRHSGQAW